MTHCRLSCVCKKRVIQCRPIKKWRRYISRQYVGLRIALNISLKPRKEVSSTLLIVRGNIPSRFPPLSSRRRRVRPSMRSRSWRSSPRCSRNPRGRSPCTRARTCRSSASRSPRTWGTPRAAPAPTRRRRRGACPCTNRIRNGDIFRRRRGICRPRWRTRRSDPRRTPNREFSLRDHSGGGVGGVVSMIANNVGEHTQRRSDEERNGRKSRVKKSCAVPTGPLTFFRQRHPRYLLTETAIRALCTRTGIIQISFWTTDTDRHKIILA